MPTNLDALVQMVAAWGIWAYVLLAALIPINGPIVTLIAGVAASTGGLSLPGVFIASAGGNLTGDSLWYIVGYLGKVEWIERYGGWLGIRMTHIRRIQRLIHERAGRLLVTAKLTMVFMIPTLIAAGLARVPWRRSIVYLALAEVIWTGGLIALGYFFGHSLQQLEQGLQVFAFIGTIIMLAVLAHLFQQARRMEPPTFPDDGNPAA
jgi:membrane protein DedA with SNARE-associated domain